MRCRSSVGFSSLFGRTFDTICDDETRTPGTKPVMFCSKRECRKVSRRAMKAKQKELEPSVSICIKDQLPDDLEILSVELSVLPCNDDFIKKLNKEWRDEDHATDVLSMSQHVPELNLPILMLGDIVISVETATRQAAHSS